MPYEVRGKCVYKKDTGKKVGCTEGDVKKYLAALHANEGKKMKVTKAKIKEMLLQELELKITKYERSHPHKSCCDAHRGIAHKDWEGGEAPVLREQEESILDELQVIYDQWKPEEAEQQCRAGLQQYKNDIKVLLDKHKG